MSTKRMRWPIFLAGLLLWLGVCAGAVHAQAVEPELHAQVTLIGEDAAYQPAVPFWVGVLFRLDPGWHVYWRNPGDSGTPPKIEWTVPYSFHFGELRWPHPMRLGKPPVIDYGYEGQVLLMTSVISPLNSIGPANITADVSYVVCREICVPAKAHLTLALPPLTGRSEHFSSDHPLFDAARRQFPQRAPNNWQMAAQVSRKSFELAVRGAAAKPGTAFFPYDPGVIDNAAPQTLTPADGGFHLTLTRSEVSMRPPAQLRGVIDIPGGAAFEISAPVTAAAPTAPTTQGAH